MARNVTPEASDGFAPLGLDERLINALTKLGYEEPTPIQREAIPPLLKGRDVIGQAATGTGKTAAFALPLIERLALSGKGHSQPAALILVPTRELAMQVAEAVYRYGHALGVSVLPIYGGQAFAPQLNGLKRGVDIVVATPGRALDHIRRGTLKLGGATTVILDEADEMLDMGFAEDLEAILSELPAKRQTVLFSATLPPRVAGIAKRHLNDPVRIQITSEPAAKGTAPRVRQTAYFVHRAHKLAALSSVLDLESPTMALVFCRTRTEVDELAETLAARGYRAEALHGGMSQVQRDRVMKKLRAGSADLVIATDVAARGLDIDQLSHVVNYDVPSAPDAYVHRIGRVGRAGREGVAITLVEPRERRMLQHFERATRHKIEVAQVPTVADLRARRLELTRTNLRETLLAGKLDGFRVVVESLAGEFDVMDVATAAVKLAHEAAGTDLDEAQDIPAPVFDEKRTFGKKKRPAHDGSSPRATGKGPHKKPTKGAGKSFGRGASMTRLYVSAGRNAGMRPQDLVGAIAGEAGISGREVGAIEIAEKFSLVDVVETRAADVIRALRATTIKGKKVTVRRNRES